MVREDKSSKKVTVAIPKNTLIIAGILIVAVIAAIIIVPIFTGKLISDQGNGNGGQPSYSTNKESCQFECCVNDERYQIRVCQGSSYQCVNNKCVKTSCPYECCPEGDFSAKVCPTDYECQNNKCIAVDSDKDGLTDIEERQFGSNPYAYDTDSDGLNDYQEKLKGTNPSNPNTDDDRYNDNADPSPTVKNSAAITVGVLNKDFGIDWIGIGLAFIGGGIVNPDMVIAKPKVTVNVKNNGNDYSSFLSYDVVFKVANTEIKRIAVQKSKILASESLTDSQSYEIKAKEIPSLIINIITQGSTQWDVEIQNIKYDSTSPQF